MVDIFTFGLLQRSLLQLNAMRDSLNDVEADRDNAIAEKNDLCGENEQL